MLAFLKQNEPYINLFCISLTDLSSESVLFKSRRAYMINERFTSVVSKSALYKLPRGVMTKHAIAHIIYLLYYQITGNVTELQAEGLRCLWQKVHHT